MTLGPRHRGTPLLAPAVLATTLVLGTALVSLTLTSLGLMPLAGSPRLSLAGFTSNGADLLLGVRETLAIAVPASLLAVAAGTAAAVLLVQATPLSRWLSVSAAGVLPVPHLVGAVSVGLLLSGSGLAARILGVAPRSWPELVGGPLPFATVIELVWKESAFVALVVAATVGRRLPILSDTAATLGARPARRLWHVTVPLMAPAAAGAGVVVLLYSAGTYEVAWLLGRAYPDPLPVLAYRLFTSIDLTARPQAAAAALVSMTLAMAAAGSTMPVLRRLGGAR